MFVGTTPITITWVSLAAAGDLNGDGADDLVAASGASTEFHVLLGGPGGFAPSYVGGSAGDIGDLAILDADRDGVEDVVVTAVGELLLYKGDGAGGLAAPTPITVNGAISGILFVMSAGDLNGDGIPDMIAADGSLYPNVYLLLGAADGSYDAEHFATAIGTPYPVVADLDGDGDLDVVAGVPAVLRINDGTGALSPVAELVLDQTGWEALGDVDGDGRSDYVIANNDGVHLAKGHGEDQPDATTLLLAEPASAAPALADMNGDGRLDIVVALSGPDRIAILHGDWAGGFGAPEFVAAPAETSLLVTGDFDGDGRPDIVAVSSDGSMVSLLLNSGLEIRADTPSQVEGRWGAVDYVFTVERYGSTTGVQTVDWAVAGFGGAAADDDDFTGPMSGVVSFADGQSEATITITVTGDGYIEPDEGFQVTLSNASGGLTISLPTATAIIVNDDSPPPPLPTLGTDGDEVVILNDAGSSYSAGGGDDMVMADGGDDFVHGNTGDDTLHGGSGDDRMHGGQGGDVLYGDDGDDVLFGDRGDDFIHGGKGDDVIDGGEGSDALAGGQGNDVIRGGDGDDILSGDRGNDTLVGGAGADVFRFAASGGADVVLDFEAGLDRVQVAGSYVLSQVGDHVLVDLGGGDTLTLLNVQLAGLPEGWIFG